MRYAQLGNTGLIVSRLGLAPFSHGQMHYSLLGRDVERDVIPLMRRYGLGLTVWSPLASGFLSGKYTRATLAAPDNRYSGFDILPFDKERGSSWSSACAKSPAATMRAWPRSRSRGCWRGPRSAAC